MKISDSVVDSSVGAFDRTLGFLFGVARGLILVSLAYIFYSWQVTTDKQEDWIRNAQTLPIVQQVSSLIIGLMPPDVADTLTKTALPTNPEVPVTPESGTVNNGQQQGLDNLIQGTTNPPAMGSGTEQ